MSKAMRNKLLFTVLGAVLVVLFLFLPIFSVVVIEGENGTCYLPCKSGDPMVFEFEHSMFHVPQREYYTIEAEGFTLNRIFFGNARAALYYDAWEVYTYTKNEDDTYEILDMNQFYDELRFALAHGTKYTLSVGDNLLDFNEAMKNSIHFKIHVSKVPLFKLL